MVKKLSVLALAGLIALPSVAGAGGGENLATKIDQLEKQIQALKSQMKSMQADQEEAFEELEEKSEAWDSAARFKFSGDFRARADYNSADVPIYYKASTVSEGVNWFVDPNATLGTEFGGDPTQNVFNQAGSMGGSNGAWGLLFGFMGGDNPMGGEPHNIAARMGADQIIGSVLYGDPAAYDFAGGGVQPGAVLQSPDQRTQALVGVMKGFTPAERGMLFGMMGFSPETAETYDNDTLYTNRMRLNMRVKATENVEFKGRLAMYKAWGMQNNPVDYTLMGGPSFLSSAMTGFDGATTRQPSDSVLRVDRAFVNWNNIGGLPMWFSIGRRPTSDGPPAQLRLGADKRMATPVNYMDYPFDGLSLGYAYSDLLGMGGTGRVRFCYGRGFDSGPTDNGDGLNDTDFAGINWDVYKKGDRFLNIQSFGAFEIFNVPDGMTFTNPLEQAFIASGDLQDGNPDVADYANGFLDRENMGNIFHTSAVFMDKHENLNYFLAAGWSRTDPDSQDELGTGLLSSWWDADYTDNKDGHSIYAGLRLDHDDLGMKFGLEYNYGSENWLAFAPGHDDMYQSKLATRGHVYEMYMIYDLPVGEAISKYGKAFMRLGWQHYKYEYTGSGMWLGAPVKIDDLAVDPMAAQFYAPTDKMDNVYLTFEAFF